MEHDFLDLDSYVQEAEKKKPENALAGRPLLPRQETELVMGNWALQLGGVGDGLNPLSWDLAVFYIYDKQDFIALSAIEGTSVEELMAKAQDAMDRGYRLGRLYTPDAPGGELAEVPAFALLPISEEQGAEVRFYEFRLPLIHGMCDWFEELIDEFIHDATVVGVEGKAMIACPECGAEASVMAIASFTGTGGFYVIKTEEGYSLTRSVGFNVEAVNHVHLRCETEGCEYDQCVDLNEHYVDHKSV